MITKAEEFITQEGLENSSAKIFPKGTLVVALYGATVGKTGILEISAASNQAVCAVSPKTKEITSKFLFWFFRYKRPEFLGASFGGAQPNISQKIIRETTIPIPPLELQKDLTDFFSIVEQKQKHHEVEYPPLPQKYENVLRIVKRVEALTTRIAKAQSLREEASREVDYLYGREVAELFTNAKDWQTYNLGELTTDVCYGTSEKAHSEKDGTPVFRMGNIQNGKLDLSGMKYMHPSQQELKKLTLQKGDILVNRTNSAELVGKCAVFDLDGDYLFASYIIRLRLDPQKANPYLVAEYINSPLGRAYMFAERKQMTGQANVNSQKLRALPIKLPLLDEQRRIVAYLDSVQARLASVRELQSATGDELSALLPSVLDRAFKGEL